MQHTLFLMFLLMAAVGVMTALGDSSRRHVYTLMDLNEVSKVDGVEQTFFVDFYMSLAYQDPDLIIDPSAEEGAKLSDAQTQHVTEKGVGVVTTEFTNKKDVVELFGNYFAAREAPGWVQKYNTSGGVLQKLHNASHNWVVFDARYAGQFKAQLSLQEFPFDKQTVVIGLEPLEQPSDLARFIVLDTADDFTVRMAEMLEWDKLNYVTSESDYYYPSYDLNYSRIVWNVGLERKPAYYVNKIVVGIVLLCLMSHLLYAIDMKDTNRLALNMTSFLGIVTYLFVLSTDVPKVAYSTRLDSFVNFSFYNCFIDFVWGIIAYTLDDHAERAEKRAEKEANNKTDDNADTVRSYTCEDENGTDATKEADAPKITGWWTIWSDTRRKLDFILCATMMVVYSSGTAILLTGAR